MLLLGKDEVYKVLNFLDAEDAISFSNCLYFFVENNTKYFQQKVQHLLKQKITIYSSKLRSGEYLMSGYIYSPDGKIKVFSFDNTAASMFIDNIDSEKAKCIQQQLSLDVDNVGHGYYGDIKKIRETLIRLGFKFRKN